jgi:tRNA-binding protein
MDSMVDYSVFESLDIRVGTIIDVQDFPEARKPAYKLKIDFGPLGVKQSSAQLVASYSKEELLGRQVAAVVNFPPKRVAGFVSEVLVLGAVEGDRVALLRPEPVAKNGLKVT